MKINHIASGSNGNCIVVDDGITQIMFDAGIKYSDLCRKVDMDKVKAIFITHEHGDHVKAVPELLLRGHRLFMSEGTRNANPKFWKSLTISDKTNVIAGSWHVWAFNVVHDAAEPVGFMFQSDTGYRGVYIADTGKLPYDIHGVTHWMIECNYSDELLNGNGDIHSSLKRRIRKFHLSIKQILEFFTTPEIVAETQEIHLIHLSDKNSNAKQFIEELEALTGIPVYTKE